MKKLLFASLMATAAIGCSSMNQSTMTGMAADGSSPARVPSMSNSLRGTPTENRPEAPKEADVPRMYPRGIDFSQAPEIITFGSGADQDEAQPIWKAILATSPDVFLFMGDNVDLTGIGRQTFSDQYKKLTKIPEYREAREKIPFLATWNDRDLGTMDGGADATTKGVARKEFLAHFTYVRDSIPFNREGLYHAKLMGGQISGRKRKKVNGPVVQLILLDTRSFRSPLKKAEDTANPLHLYDASTDKSTTILGEDQWEWLEDELRVPAQFRIIVSPIQLIATQNTSENWNNFPHERERFFNLIKKTGVKNLIVLSGDRRLGAIAKTEIKGWGNLLDVTAGPVNMPNDLVENDKAYINPAFTKENFGLMKVDWKRKNVKIELRDIEGKTIQSTEMKLR